MLSSPRIAAFVTPIFRALAGLILCASLASAVWSQEHTSVPTKKDSPEQSFQAAQTFQVAGDYEQAAVEYREAIAQALQQMGNVRISHQQYNEATELLAQAVQVAPARLEARIDLAIACFLAQDFPRAKTEIEAALRQNPHNPRALNLAGRIYFIQGSFEDAAARLEAAFQLQPDFDIGYILALTDLQLKKPAAASIIFDEMLASSKPSASLLVLIGFAYRETGYLDQAVSHFSKAIALEPRKPRVRSSLGLAYFLQGPQSYAKAREQFLAELSITPDDYTSRYYLGMIAAKGNHQAEAEEWFRQAVSGHQKDPDAYFQLGRASFDAGHFEQAIAALRESLTLSRLVENHPDPALVHELLGKALERLGRQEEAKSETEQAKQLRDQPLKPDPRQTAATAAAAMESALPSRSGQQELRAMLLQAPGKSELPSSREAEYVKQLSTLLGEAYHNLGVIDARASRYPGAADEFAEAARWNPGIETLDRNWGLAAFRAQRYDQAVGPLERQFRRAPGDSDLRQMLALSYYMTDDFKKSAETFRPILDELPENPGLLFAAGVALGRAGDSVAAGRIFSRMLERGAGSPEVHLLVGQAYYGQSQYPEALLEFQRALQLDSRLPEAHYFAGMVYFRQGQLDLAAQEFNSELSVNSQSVPARYQLAYVRLQQRQTEAAIELLNQVLAQKPSYGDAHYQLGKALLEKGDLQAAVQQLEISTQLQPAQSYGYYQLSLAYRRIGRLQEADKALRTYQQLKDKTPRQGPRDGPSMQQP